MTPARSRAVAALAAACTLIPVSSASAGGGDATTAPVANPDPCALVEAKSPTESVNFKSTIKLDVRLTSCAGAAESVTLTTTGYVTRPDMPDYRCDLGTQALSPVTLRPGDSRGITITPPASRCYAGYWHYTVTARDAVSGVELSAADVVVAHWGGSV